MATNRPVKGILKSSASFDKDGVSDPNRKEMKWDEMNILATYHPADKDYGHTKIDEPPTPYNKMDGEEFDSEEEADGLDANNLAARLESGTAPRVLAEEEESSEEEEEDLTEEEKERRKSFEQKRKLHYNEYHAIKLARQLMDEEEEEEEDSNSKENTAASSSKQKDSSQTTE